MKINSFDGLKYFLQTDSLVIKEIESKINGLGSPHINASIVKILKEEDKDVVAPEELRETQQFWMNEKGQIDVHDGQGMVANSNRIDNIEETLNLSFGYLESSKEILMAEINGLSDRINNFKEYLKGFSAEEKLPLLLRQFCQYTNLLLQENNKATIVECLREFPPISEFATEHTCIDGTAARMQEQIRKIIFPRHNKPFIDAYNLALKQGAESLLPLVRHAGNHIHIEPFLEYSLGFKTGALIKDQNYGIPRADIFPNEIWKISEQFPISLKSFLIEQYKNYNGAIALFSEHMDISALLEGVGWQSFCEQRRELGFGDGVVLMGENDDGDAIWNWDVIAEKLEELQLQDFHKFISNMAIEELVSITDNSQSSIDYGNISDASTDSVDYQEVGSLSPELLKIKAKDIAKDLLSADSKKQETSLRALWFLSYLNENGRSYTLFMEAIYELGERYYKQQKKSGNLEGLDQNDHFENAKIFLKSIQGKIPEGQRFRIDDIAGAQDKVARIDFNHFKIHARAIACQRRNDYLVSKTGYSLQNSMEINFKLMDIAISGGFENLAEKLLNDFSITNNPNNYLDINNGYGGDCFLHKAIKSGHTKLVSKFLDLGADINIKNFTTGRTAISYVAENGDLKMIDILKDANINLLDLSRKYPLHYAVENGRVDVVMKLIKRGANLNGFVVKFSDQVSADNQEKIKNIFQMGISIFESVKSNNIELFEKLTFSLEDDLLRSYLLSKDGSGKTVVYYAAENGNVEILKKLIEYGCDVNSSDAPLTAAAYNGHLEVVKYLVDKGADLSKTNSNKQNSLKLAIYRKKENIISFLLEKGAVVDSQDILKSIKNNNIDLFNKLISSMTGDLLKSDIHLMKDEYEKTVVYYAAENGNVEILKKLIEYGCDVNSSDAPLTAAVFEGHLGAVKYLVSNGAHLGQVNLFNQTLLHIAVTEEHTDMVKFLLENGADVNLKDNLNRTPMTISKGVKDIEILLKSTCDLFSAVANGDLEGVKMAIKGGALVTAKNPSGSTILELAMVAGNDGVIKTMEVEISEQDNKKRKHSSATEEQEAKHNKTTQDSNKRTRDSSSSSSSVQGSPPRSARMRANNDSPGNEGTSKLTNPPPLNRRR